MDWIQGDKFSSIADFVYAPAEHVRDDYSKLPNTLNLYQVPDPCIVYTHTVYVNQLFHLIKHHPSRFIIISHNGDVNIDESFHIPDNVIRWFSQNANMKHPKLEALPIGLENDRWFKNVHKKETMLEVLKTSKSFKNWMYVNVNVGTNPRERAFAYTQFTGEDWATVDRGKNGVDFQTYLLNIYTHPFVLCPPGNGIDTHRFWETLYMGSFPVVKRCPNIEYFEKLFPMVVVHDWAEVTKDLLEAQLKNIKNNRESILEYLNFIYWKDKILKTKLL